jgi:hypothetical protein
MALKLPSLSWFNIAALQTPNLWIELEAIPLGELMAFHFLSLDMVHADGSLWTIDFVKKILNYLHFDTMPSRQESPRASQLVFEILQEFLKIMLIWVVCIFWQKHILWLIILIVLGTFFVRPCIFQEHHSLF